MPERDKAEALRIDVLFTGTAQTLRAVRQAAALAAELRASIRILLIQVVPFPLPLENPRVRPEFRLRQLYANWNGQAIETRIDVRLCRDARRCLEAALTPHSIVVVGETGSRWPFSGERRLLRCLKKDGRQVITVRCAKSWLAGRP